MKVQTRDKDKDKQSSIGIKSRIIIMEERIEQQIQDINTLQQKYDTVKDDIEKMKEINKGKQFDDSNSIIAASRYKPLSDSIHSMNSSLDQFVKNCTNGSIHIETKDKVLPQQTMMTKGLTNEKSMHSKQIETLVKNANGSINGAIKELKLQSENIRNRKQID